MASPITITIADDHIENAKVKIVRFEGQLDGSNVDDNAPIIYDGIEAMEEGTHLIFDFEGLTYMNSKSIGYLTDWHLKVTEKGGSIIIARPKENIKDTLNVVGLTPQVIRSFPTLDEARLSIVQAQEIG